MTRKLKRLSGGKVKDVTFSLTHVTAAKASVNSAQLHWQRDAIINAFRSRVAISNHHIRRHASITPRLSTAVTQRTSILCLTQVSSMEITVDASRRR